MTRTAIGRLLRRSAAALAAAALGTLLVSGPAGATAPADGGAGQGTGDTAAAPAPQSAPQSAPQLSISIDNGRTEASAGQTLAYVTTVTNLGPSAVSDLMVTQSVPAGLELVSAADDGAAQEGVVTWQVSLEPAASATLHTTMTVLETPAELLRLASVACATTAADAPPIVCATHSDQLPAGAAAAKTSAAAENDGGGSMPWLLGGGAVLVLAVGGAAVFALRRRA